MLCADGEQGPYQSERNFFAFFFFHEQHLAKRLVWPKYDEMITKYPSCSFYHICKPPQRSRLRHIIFHCGLHTTRTLSLHIFQDLNKFFSGILLNICCLKKSLISDYNTSLALFKSGLWVRKQLKPTSIASKLSRSARNWLICCSGTEIWTTAIFNLTSEIIKLLSSLNFLLFESLFSFKRVSRDK